LTSFLLQARNRSPDIEIIDILDDDSSESVSSGPRGNFENSTLPGTQTVQIPVEKSKRGELPLCVKREKRAVLGSDSHEEEQRSSPVYPPPSEKSSPVMESSFVFPHIETLSPVFSPAEKSSPVEESSSTLPRKETSSPVFPRGEESSPVLSPVDVQETESEMLRCKECGSGQDDLRGLATHAFQHSFQLGARLMRGNIVSSID
jgi:hypothetical protein